MKNLFIRDFCGDVYVLSLINCTSFQRKEANNSLVAIDLENILI